MTIETPPQAPLNEEQKEAALRKSKLFKMREILQADLIKKQYPENFIKKQKSKDQTDEERKLELEAVHRWVSTGSSGHYRQAFDQVLQEHPDLLETYEHNPEEAINLIHQTFEHIHQAAQTT